ncbi:MAG: hypothetical protein M5R40_05750 [Anaerolineae bacterium]|nr:hypothetical protein [Anaerolineae bacterium]
MRKSTRATPDAWSASLRSINDLPYPQKEAIYRTLLPDWIFAGYGIDRETLAVGGERVVYFRCPAGSRSLRSTCATSPARRTRSATCT